METKKKKVLFLCTHNSARSQIAEGLLRTLYGDRYEAFSAGAEPTTLNPYVVKVMLEIGIDLSGHHSKSINEFRKISFDYVVTVCDKAKDLECPFYYGLKVDDVSFPDPSDFKGSDEDILCKVRDVRDEIKNYIIKTFGEQK
ncbi:arsenate reductase ArsC [Sporomusa malonica]|uniref:Arsenate reductase n=1 Tax=Sporomusa malonica TaxID=112901 RepID=A0A1W2DRD0_9FIRM|nr:arsenate reductase ArsC [Sporomusa malonica]SMC99688.1 arsenate reductase [Sporomusa malonica]